METPFTKMHGLGNDFVVFDCFGQDIQLDPESVRSIADRRFGIGCDQVLLLGPPENGKGDVRYRIYNADGGEVSQCGNGARCVAAYLRQKGLIDKNEIIAETNEGELRLYVEDDERVRVDMGIPRLEPDDIPLKTEQRAEQYPLQLEGIDVKLSVLSMGNPHAVLEVDDVEQAPVHILGPQIQESGLFPESVNVGFMQIIDRQHILLRVYERGAGETLACGSGACAAVVAGYLGSSLDENVDVSLRGGHLSISWQGEGESVWMIGPATFVYEGRILL